MKTFVPAYDEEKDAWVCYDTKAKVSYVTSPPTKIAVTKLCNELNKEIDKEQT